MNLTWKYGLIMPDILGVWLSGNKVGCLHRLTDGQIELLYDSEYVNSQTATPISHSMPLHSGGAGPHVVEPWFDNLISENQGIKDDWAREFRITNRSTFEYLTHVGYDLAGAVQVLPDGMTPPTAGYPSELTEEDIAGEIKRIRLHQNDGGFADIRNDLGDKHVHLSSISGQQAKFALTRTADGTWGLPLGRYPSTHIFKFGFDGIEDSELVEHVTAQAAAKLGLDVSHTSVQTFGDEVSVVVERFDRRLGSNNEVERIHQEDFCQALGVRFNQKYESDGGPGMTDAVTLIREVSQTPSERQQSTKLFVRSVVFNLLTAGIDAHAKNYSLLYANGGARVAPLYDLNNGFMLVPEKELLNKRRLAMKYGKTYSMNKLSGRNADRTADSLLVSREYFRAELERQAEIIVDAFSDATAALSPKLRSRIPIPNYLTSMDAHVRGLVKNMGAVQDFSNLPFTPVMHKQDTVSREIWVSGHIRDGKVIPGHYRHRPASR